MAQALDGLLMHAGRTIDNTGMRDWIYVAAYISAVYVSYIAIVKIPEAMLTLGDFLAKLPGFAGPAFGLGQQAGFTIVGVNESQYREDVAAMNYTDPTAANFKISSHALAVSMIAAYGMLKIDMADVTSAVKVVASVAAKI